MSDITAIRNLKSAMLSESSVTDLKEKARRVRAASIVMTSVANSGHPAGPLSSADIFTLLWGVINATPENVDCVNRDRVVVSHGHTSPGVYGALATWGFFEIEEAEAHFRKVGSPFQGHIHREVPGIDWGTGNLGQGLSAGVGFALAAKARNSSAHTYVIMGDGEQPKGQLAEARRIAIKHKLTQITALIDWNNIQISGNLDAVMPTNIRAIWEADGWKVLETDGHDFVSLYSALREAQSSSQPTVILCKTLMGKGVSFMEGTPEYHGKTVSGERLEQALRELGYDMTFYEKALTERKNASPTFQRRDASSICLELGTPISYNLSDKKDNRGAFGSALAEVAALNCGNSDATPIIAMDCDLAGSVKLDSFAKQCPESFLQMGIQEHATATVAGAASVAGVVSVWADFGVFGLDEVYNQQRLNDVNHSSTKTVLTHVGLDVGEDGSTHQCIDYVSLLRNLFHWKLVVPADPNQTDRATRWALTENTNVCLAMGRSVLPVITKEDGSPYYAGDYTFVYGAIDTIRTGTDGTLLAMGHMVSTALDARALLQERGISVQVLQCATPLGMCKEQLLNLVGDLPILTCEDHHVETGMGSIVANILADSGKGVSLKRVGVTRYGQSGVSKDVFKEMQMTAVDIADQFETLIRGSVSR